MALGNSLSWPEFLLRVDGLLTCNSRLTRHLTREYGDRSEGVDDGG